MIPNPDADYEVRSSVLVDGGDRFGVSAVTFDKFEELIWMGNAGVSSLPCYGIPQESRHMFFVISILSLNLIMLIMLLKFFR